MLALLNAFIPSIPCIKISFVNFCDLFNKHFEKSLTLPRCISRQMIRFEESNIIGLKQSLCSWPVGGNLYSAISTSNLSVV